MGLLYENIIRPILFKQDPERAHDMSNFALRMLGQVRPVASLMQRYNATNAEPIKLFGLTFPNRVGIAAGFDKNAECINAASALGFGHIEVGTVTYQRQPGNPKPRLFRFPNEQAVINAMGFNNDGAQVIADRLSKLKRNHTTPVGINIGKSKATPLDEAIQDYISSFYLLADHADYFTINVSSPNTQGVRALQSKEYLPALLESLQSANRDRAKKMGSPPIPMLLKIAPDLSFREIDFVLEAIQEYNFSGIIATNTSLQRPGNFQNVDTSGGLSGAPLHPLALKVIRYIHLATNGTLPIIGSGGIMDPESAGKFIDVGASLIQVYTGLIYKGPFLGSTLAKSLAWSHSKDWI